METGSGSLLFSHANDCTNLPVALLNQARLLVCLCSVYCFLVVSCSCILETCCNYITWTMAAKQTPGAKISTDVPSQITTHHALSEAFCYDVHSAFPQFHDTRDPCANINSPPTTQLHSSFDLISSLPSLALSPTDHRRYQHHNNAQHHNTPYDESCLLHALSTNFPYNSCINSHYIAPTSASSPAKFVPLRSSAALFCSLAKFTTQPRAIVSSFTLYPTSHLITATLVVGEVPARHNTAWDAPWTSVNAIIQSFGISGNGIKSCVYRSSEGLDTTAQSFPLID